jgi:hypothetical protein
MIDSGNVLKIKFCLTLMTLSKILSLTKKEKKNHTVDYSSITDKSTSKGYTIPQKFINQVIKDYNLGFKPYKYTSSDMFISLKMGPHGPTSLSMLETIKYLGHSQLYYLRGLINDDSFFVKHIGYLYTKVMHNDYTIPKGYSLKKYFVNTDKKITGRISIIEDAEGKFRPVAISDYFSQFILKPIHVSLFNNLKKFPCDRTFNQNPLHS